MQTSHTFNVPYGSSLQARVTVAIQPDDPIEVVQANHNAAYNAARTELESAANSLAAGHPQPGEIHPLQACAIAIVNSGSRLRHAAVLDQSDPEQRTWEACSAS